MKRKQTLLLVLLGAIFVLFAFVVSRSLKKESAVVIPLSTISELSAPRVFESSSSTSFSFSGEQPTLPSKLPSYKIIRKDTTDEKRAAVLLATRLGFTSADTSPVEGVFDWIEGFKQFTYDSRSHRISFSIASGGEKNQINKESVLLLFRETGVINDSLLIKEISTDIFRGEENAQQTYLSVYGYYIDSLPLIFNPVDKTAGSFITLANGSVVSFSFTLSPRELNRNDERQLMSIEEILTAANQQKGFLSGVKSSKTEYPYTVTPSFSSVRITQIDVVYLLLEEENTLVPLYVLSGVGNNSQRVEYFLRASFLTYSCTLTGIMM